VSITIYSEPRFLGTYTVNNQGEFSANVTVPMDLEEGEHTLVAEGVNQNGDSLKTSVGVSYDRTAPSIVSVSPTSGSLTVGDTLTITVVANDSSDIRNLFVRFFDVTGGGQVQRDFCGTPYFLTRTSGSGAGNQTWSKTCVVPDGVISGDYEIRPVAEDIFGNYNMAGTVMTKGNMSIVGGVSDRTAPSIVSVSPTSGSFTVGDTLTITVVANDSSDIRNMLVRFFDVTGGGQVQRDFCGTPYFLTRTSGSGAGNQTWSKTCVVPDGVISGDYEIRPVAEDKFGNYNMAGTVMTKGNMSIVGGVSDRTAPSIVSVSPTSGSFTVGDTLTITVVANDSSDIRNMLVRFFDVTGGGQVQRDFCGTPYFLTRTSGSGAGNQTWSKTCVVPDGVISGDYEIRPVAEDTFGNYNMAGTVMTKGSFRITGD
jgi:tRNA threonylcarbamoyladenosine modification (KEOPS) complex  Pcc1 subunit